MNITSISVCQNCAQGAGFDFLTGYSLVGHVCDKCRRVSDCAMVRERRRKMMEPDNQAIDHAAGEHVRIGETLNWMEIESLCFFEEKRRRRSGPSAITVDHPRLKNLGLVVFVKETRSGTEWYRLTDMGLRVVDWARQRGLSVI